MTQSGAINRRRVTVLQIAGWGLIVAAVGMGVLWPRQSQLLFAGVVFLVGCSVLTLAKPFGTKLEQIAYLGFVISLAAAFLALALHSPERLSRALVSLACVLGFPVIFLEIRRRQRDYLDALDRARGMPPRGPKPP